MTSLELRVGNIWVDIVGDLPPSNWKDIERKLSFRPKDFMFSELYNKWIKDEDGNPVRRCWDGWKRQAWKNTKRTYFPTGLYSLVTEYFKEKGIKYRVVDLRKKPDSNIDLALSPKLVERDYQSRVCNDACRQQRGIVQAATGSGKTAIAAGIIQRISVAPFIFFVTSIDLLEQAKSALEDFLLHNGSPLRVGQIGAGVIDIKDINVATVQTIVRALGKKWDKSTKFDVDDTDDLTPIEQYRDEIVDLVHNAKGAASDECITGDSTVILRSGKVRMDQLFDRIGEEILSFSGNSVVWKKITRFYRQGKRTIVKVRLSNGMVIRCTSDHPIMTSRGWVSAGLLLHTDHVLCYANAGAESILTLPTGVQADSPSLSLDIKSTGELSQSGNKYSKHIQRQRRSVNVGVDSRSNFVLPPFNLLLNKEEPANIDDSPMGMIRDQTNGTSASTKSKNEPFWELYSGTHRLYSHQAGARTQDCAATMVYDKRSGQSLSATYLLDFQPNTGNTKTAAMANEPHHLERPVIQSYFESMPLPIEMVENESLQSGLIELGASGLRGGSVMTAAAAKTTCGYTRKDSTIPMSISRQTGFEANMEKRQFISQEGIRSFTSAKNREILLSMTSRSTCPSVCHINYVDVDSVVECGKEDVYDISVEDTHCFFANGILVHNCQHWKAETCQLIARQLYNAYYTYGLSATPYRDEGDDMMINACFGKKVAEITASELIRNGWLIKPNIKMVHIRGKRSKYRQWQSIYKDQVAENERYNGMVANVTNAYIEKKRLVLVLVQQINHGKLLSSMIPGSVFLSGASSKGKRLREIERLRAKDIRCIISTVIFDEGIDVRPLDTLILAGQGKSRVRAMQRIGRILRPYTDPNTGVEKTTATAIDFCIHQRYLEDHAIEREKMYRTEPEFAIEDIDPRLS